MERNAFISHASPDRDAAQKICDFLEQRGISCWIAPRDVRPGHDYAAEIMAGLADSQALVLVMSENANESIYVKREVERAVSSGKPVFPIRIREVSPSQSLEFFVASAQWIDAWKPPMEQYLDQLAKALHSAGSIGSNGTSSKPDRTPPKSSLTRKKFVGRRGIAFAILAVALIAGAGWVGYGIWHNGTRPATPNESLTPVPEGKAHNNQTESAGEAVSTPRGQKPEDFQQTESGKTEQQKQESKERASTGKNTVRTAPDSHRKQFTDALTLLQGASGTKRYDSIKRLLENKRIPKRLNHSEMLEIIDGSNYRLNVIDLLIERLPKPLSYEAAAEILGTTKGTERYNTIKLLNQHERLPKRLSVDEMLSLVASANYRQNAIEMLIGLLPKPLSYDEVAEIIGNTKGTGRYNLIKLIVEEKCMPNNLSTDQMLTLVEASNYQTNAIRMLVEYLPQPLSFENAMKIVGPAKGNHRYNLIEVLADSKRFPKDLTSSQALALVESSNYRQQALDLLQY